MSLKYNFEYVEVLHLLDQMMDFRHECLPWHVRRALTKNGFHYRFSHGMACDEKILRRPRPIRTQMNNNSVLSTNAIYTQGVNSAECYFKMSQNGK